MAEAVRRANYHHGDLRRALIEAGWAIVEEDGPEALTLRGVARQAGVSHAAPAHHFPDKAALVEAMAVEGWNRFGAALASAWRGEATGPGGPVGVEVHRLLEDNADRPPGNDASQPPGNDAGKPPGNDAGQPPGNDAGQPPENDAGQPPEDGPYAPERLAEVGAAYVRFAAAHPHAFRLMNRPELRAGKDTAVAAAAGAARDVLAAGVRECQAGGFIPAGDPAPWALLCWSGVHGLAMLAIDGLIDLFRGGPGELELTTSQVLTAMGHGLAIRPEPMDPRP